MDEYDELFEIEDQFEEQFADELEVLAQMEEETSKPAKRPKQDNISDIEHLLHDQPSTPKAKRQKSDAGVAKRLFNGSQTQERNVPSQPDDITPPSSPEQYEPSNTSRSTAAVLDISGFAEIPETPRRAVTPTPASTRVLKRPPLEGEFITVTDSSGNRVYLRQKEETDTKTADSRIVPNSYGGLGLLALPIRVLREQEAERRHQQVVEESQRLSELLVSSVNEVFAESENPEDEENEEPGDAEGRTSRLWVDRFSPRHYTELLSDDFTNRCLLKWLKLWDTVVFGREKKSRPARSDRQAANQNSFKSNQGGQNQNRFKSKVEMIEEILEAELDQHKRPKHKVALLSGPPGLGKTTLAHVIAKHAGYNVVEINASDDRSAEVFQKRIDTATQMKSVLGANERPNCLIIDEIDGAPAAAINILLSVLNRKDGHGGETGTEAAKKKKKKESILLRPIICICNDLIITMASPFLSCLVLGMIISAFALPRTEPPLVRDHPFVAIWNAPTDQCKQLEIPLDTAAFQAVTTPSAVPGQFLTIFYEDRLGLYPKVDIIKHKIYKGGIPQNGNLTEHLAKAKSTIDRYISQDSSPGLAVIDWESWRPLWDQNWGSKRIYQKLSLTHALQLAPFLSTKQVSKMAKSQFEQAGRRFMEKTISIGIGKRPSRRWGFYLLPDCFNYGWDKPLYTGQCSAKTQKQNNKLLWLWERSTALFPSIYLHLTLRNSPRAALYVRNRVQEALRVAALPNRPYTVPVYVYSRPLYRDQTQKFQTQTDLVNTIGESAALGASGVVIWGGTRDYNNKASCQSLSEYLSSTFSPYVANVTAAAMLCSQVLCQGNGRCVRKNYSSPHYLHLNPASFQILKANGKYVAVGLPSANDLNHWVENFTCQCYAGWSCFPALRRPTKVQLIRV